MRGDNIDEKNILQFAQEQGIIDIALLQQQYEQMKREKIIESHKIWQASDGRWKTYIEVAGKRRLIAKSDRATLEDAIIEAYKDPKVKFRDCFDGWLSEKLQYGEIQKQTYDRYEADYKRYIEGTDLEYKEVKCINELYLEDFIKSTIADNHLTAKNWGNMRILINGAMIYARKHGYSDMRISLFFAELNLSSKIFARHKPEDEKQVYRRDEEELLEKYITDNQDMLGLGVALAFETGLRVGEVAALKWSDYQDDTLIVQRTEIKYKNEHGEWVEEVRNFTKGRDGIRQVVLTDAAQEYLRRLYTYTGSEDGYVFLRNGERIKAAWLSNKIESLCRRVNIPHRSFHKIRKTYATKLEQAGVSDIVKIKQLGHTEILTTKKFYYYNNEEVADIKATLEKV